MRSDETNFDGGCSCRHVRYRMNAKPMFVHCCHCSWCQRETGTAFALNALIETERVTLLAGDVEIVDTPSASGRGQRIARCPRCHIALWSHYAIPQIEEALSFVRIGTLDDPGRLRPDIHIYTSTKLPWVRLPPDVPATTEYYKASEHWSAESLARRAALASAGKRTDR